MATPEKMVNVRTLEGGPLHIEIAIPGADAKAPATRKMVIIPGSKDAASNRGVNVPASEWDLAKVKPMVKGLLDAGTLLASA
jgi:hypothetical protein